MAADGVPIVGSLYVYAPNQIAPVFFTIAYALSAAGHIWQCYRFKCFNMIGLHPICGVLFTVGYALREYGSFNYMYSTSNLIVMILSVVFVYACPPLLELANYQILGRVFYYVPHLSPLDPGKVLSVFGGLSVLVEVLNGVGVSLYANPEASHTAGLLGKYMTLSAVSLQILIIAVFIPMAVVFQRRCARANITAKAVHSVLKTLYISSALIFARCIYRLVEKTGNTTIRVDDPEILMALSPTLRYEWYFMVFEATLMLLNSVLWNVRHPRHHLPNSYRLHLAMDGRTEVEADEEPNVRSLLAHLIDPFGLYTGKKKQKDSFTELEEHSTVNH